MLNTLTTSDVRQTLEQFRRSVDQMFENFYGFQMQPAAMLPSGERAAAFTPAIESGWTDNALHVRAILPGVVENDVEVSIQNNQLIIEGERKTPPGFEKNVWTHLPYGRFYTAVTLPGALDYDHVNCRLHDGVLDIQIPVAETCKPKHIPIQTAEAKKLARV